MFPGSPGSHEIIVTSPKQAINTSMRWTERVSSFESTQQWRKVLKKTSYYSCVMLPLSFSLLRSHDAQCSNYTSTTVTSIYLTLNQTRIKKVLCFQPGMIGSASDPEWKQNVKLCNKVLIPINLYLWIIIINIIIIIFINFAHPSKRSRSLSQLSWSGSYSTHRDKELPINL